MNSKKSALLALLCSFSLFLNISFAANEIPANHPYIQYFGRWTISANGTASHSWPGVYIYAEFEGTSIGIKLADDYTYYNIFIDGTFLKVFKGTSSAVTSYTLIGGLPDGEHSILITKRCETTWTKFIFHGFLLDDGKELLSPPAKPVRKIEFIGDSFTSASGNEYTEPGRPPEGDAAYTNIYDGFGPIIARNYDAQYTMTSLSGIGLLVDWQGSYTNQMHERFFWSNIYSASSWNFDNWVPNLVVIGLGLNDISGFDGWAGEISEDETKSYKDTYHKFIQDIRDVYPGVKILAAATHVEWMRQTISEIVHEENEEGFGDVFYAQYSYYNDGYVNEGHPNVETHYHIADELIAAIDTIDTWTPYIDTRSPQFSSIPDSPYIIYETNYELNVSTDSYCTVRFSKEDKAYEEMENDFTTTGKRDHSVFIPCKQDSQYTFYLRAMDRAGNVTDSSAVVSFTLDTLQTPVRWKDKGYPALNWKTGPTPFGINIADVTELNAVNTAYFRRSFVLDDDPDSLKYFSVKTTYDDGAIIYINGREFKRVNMAEGECSYDSMALGPVYRYEGLIFSKSDYTLLNKGENLIAVEVHQYNDNNMDMFFNCRIMSKALNASKYDTLIHYGDEWSYFDLGYEPADTTKGALNFIPEKQQNILVSFDLKQNYPNPFNPSTQISFKLKRREHVTLTVYDVLGRKIRTLVNSRLNSGVYHTEFNGSDLSSGIYFYRLKAAGFSEIKKCILVK